MVRKEFNKVLRERGIKKAVKSYATNNTHCPAQAARPHTTIQQLTLLTKPQLKFFVWLIKRWWMLPIITIILVLGVVLVLAQSSVIAPFIYTLF